MKKINNNVIKIKTTAVLLAVVSILSGCSIDDKAVAADYSDMDNWAYYESEDGGEADIFFISPTSCHSDGDEIIAAIGEESNSANLGSINMEKGIYDVGRFFAPYYDQLTLEAYTVDENERLDALEECYTDVKAAFDYYMENENNGRPIIIAGFSQGAEHGLRLVGEYSSKEDFREQLVAAYLIGWRVTDEDIENYENISLAKGENDTGVIIAFDCEAENVKDTIVVPDGESTYSINPLNWKTDETPALKSENMGACFTDYDGNITDEIPQLCGARIDSERGTIKVDDIIPEEYPAALDIFPEGSYHIYDYQFFYRNLQENVKTRLDKYMDENRK